MCRKKISKTSHTRIDKCMRPLIRFLRDSDYITIASCCGHNRYPITVVIDDGYPGVKPDFVELFSGKHIPRTRRFYKRDSKGYYYIPEVSKEVK
jgi:hypothetical protein